MNQEIKKRWVEALRSGKFEQGKGQLCNEGRYCCLGVLELLASQEGVVTFVPTKPYLSPSVVEWAGLNKVRGSINSNPRIGDGIGEYCGNLNDEGYSFNEIADRIEKYL